MIALTALIAIALWGLLGLFLWNYLIKPHIHSPTLKICLGLFMAVVWFVWPVLDDILGARKFDQLCRETPPIKFYGPIALGPGAFFDEQGQPKWSNSNEFWKIKNADAGSEYEISVKSDGRLLCEWPMPITEEHSIYFDKKSGAPVVESFSRRSSGGWLRRNIGGTMGGYQCPSKGWFPKDEEFIIFKPEK